MIFRLDEEAEKTASRFQSTRALHGYSRGKLAMDPAYAAIRTRLNASGPLPVLDIGCGVGLFAAFLRDGGWTPPILGVEPDRAKVEIARAAVPEAEFQVGSVKDAAGFSGHVVVLDVLHYLDDAGRLEFLREIADCIAPNGKAWIRTTLRDGSWRYWMTQIEEAFVRSSKWIVGGHWNFPTGPQVREPFEELGYSVQSEPMWGRTPFNSYLFEIRRCE